MKYFNLIILLTISFLVISCENSNEPTNELEESLPSISIEWNDNNSIVCFGTSITRGGANADSSYPSLLSKELKINVINEGHWGDFTYEGIERFNTDVLSKNPCLILLEFGANEFLKDHDVDIAKADIDSLIQIIIGHDVKVVLLSFVNPDMLNNTSGDNTLTAKSYLAIKYYEMLRGLADENDIPFVNYIYKNIWGNNNLMQSDGVHPNNKGNVQLKKNIFNALYNTFEKNDMLK